MPLACGVSRVTDSNRPADRRERGDVFAADLRSRRPFCVDANTGSLWPVTVDFLGDGDGFDADIHVGVHAEVDVEFSTVFGANAAAPVPV